MYGDPASFAELVLSHNVICLTATIPDSDLNQLENEYLENLKFKMYSYEPKGLPQSSQLIVDQKVKISDDGELVRIIDAPVEISEQYVDNQVNYTIREVYDW